MKVEDMTKGAPAPVPTAKGFDFVLHDLCRGGDWLEVRSCLKVLENAARIPDQSGDLPLHVALSRGCPRDVAEVLIAAHPEGVVSSASSARSVPSVKLSFFV